MSSTDKKFLDSDGLLSYHTKLKEALASTYATLEEFRSYAHYRDIKINQTSKDKIKDIIKSVFELGDTDNIILARDGNSKVITFNQLVKNGNFVDGSEWSPLYGTETVVDNTYIYTITDPKTSNANRIESNTKITCTNGHIYYVTITAKTSVENKRINLTSWDATVSRSGISTVFTSKSTTTFTTYNVFTTFTGTTSNSYAIRLGLFDPNGTGQVGDIYEVKNFQIFDLTLMFGAGNEPTTAEEFRAMFPNDYYEYNEGTVEFLNGGNKYECTLMNAYDDYYVAYINDFDHKYLSNPYSLSNLPTNVEDYEYTETELTTNENIANTYATKTEVGTLSNTVSETYAKKSESSNKIILSEDLGNIEDVGADADGSGMWNLVGLTTEDVLKYDTIIFNYLYYYKSYDEDNTYIAHPYDEHCFYELQFGHSDCDIVDVRSDYAALTDVYGNVIDETYATKEELSNEINNLTTVVESHDEHLAALTDGETDMTWVLKARKAENDIKGNSIVDTYATKTEVGTISNTVNAVTTYLSDIRYDEFTVNRAMKAAQDRHGNLIDETYATKTEVGTLSNTVDNVIENAVFKDEENILNEASYLFRETASEETDVTSPVAEIKSIKGNTVKWNQLCQFEGYWGKNDSDQAVLTRENNVITETSYKDNYANFRMYYPVNNSIRKYYGIAGHEILISYDIKANKELTGSPYLTISYSTTGNTKSISKYITGKKVNSNWQSFSCLLEMPSDSCGFETAFFIPTDISSDIMNGDSYSLRNVNIFDLTSMFGAGNEPATVEEFRKMFPKSYYEYDPGSVKHVNIEGINTVGFNAINIDGCVEDTGWTKGAQFKENTYIVGPSYNLYVNKSAVDYYDVLNGQINVGSKSGYGVAFPIKVIGGKNYQVSFSAEYNATDNMSGLAFFDASCNQISFYRMTSSTNVNHNFTTPDNAHWCLIVFAPYYTEGSTATFSNICFHLVHDGAKNGVYEPYTTDYRVINTKLYFPDGMKGINGVCDELTPYKSIKRIGSVDLGTLTWTPRGYDGKFYSYHGMSNVMTLVALYIMPNILCSKYNVATVEDIYTNVADKIISSNIGGYFEIRDLDFEGKTAAEVKAALSGVILYYELAEPVVTDHLVPLNWTYYCEDYGTEEVILSEGDILAPTIETLYYAKLYYLFSKLIDDNKTLKTLSERTHYRDINVRQTHHDYTCDVIKAVFELGDLDNIILVRNGITRYECVLMNAWSDYYFVEVRNYNYEYLSDPHQLSNLPESVSDYTYTVTELATTENVVKDIEVGGNELIITKGDYTTTNITVPYASNASSATSAAKDGSGNTITSTYATKTEVEEVEATVTQNKSNIEGVIGGSIAAFKSSFSDVATKDNNGNVIVDTYATKTEVSNVDQDVYDLRNTVQDLDADINTITDKVDNVIEIKEVTPGNLFDPTSSEIVDGGFYVNNEWYTSTRHFLSHPIKVKIGETIHINNVTTATRIYLYSYTSNTFREYNYVSPTNGKITLTISSGVGSEFKDSEGYYTFMFYALLTEKEYITVIYDNDIIIKEYHIKENVVIDSMNAIGWQTISNGVNLASGSTLDISEYLNMYQELKILFSINSDGSTRNFIKILNSSSDPVHTINLGYLINTSGEIDMFKSGNNMCFVKTAWFGTEEPAGTVSGSDMYVGTITGGNITHLMQDDANSSCTTEVYVYGRN